MAGLPKDQQALAEQARARDNVETDLLTNRQLNVVASVYKSVVRSAKVAELDLSTTESIKVYDNLEDKSEGKVKLDVATKAKPAAQIENFTLKPPIATKKEPLIIRKAVPMTEIAVLKPQPPEHKTKPQFKPIETKVSYKATHDMADQLEPSLPDEQPDRSPAVLELEPGEVIISDMAEELPNVKWVIEEWPIVEEVDLESTAPTELLDLEEDKLYLPDLPEAIDAITFDEVFHAEIKHTDPGTEAITDWFEQQIDQLDIAEAAVATTILATINELVSKIQAPESDNFNNTAELVDKLTELCEQLLNQLSIDYTDETLATLVQHLLMPETTARESDTAAAENIWYEYMREISAGNPSGLSGLSQQLSLRHIASRFKLGFLALGATI